LLFETLLGSTKIVSLPIIEGEKRKNIHMKSILAEKILREFLCATNKDTLHSKIRFCAKQERRK